MSEQNHYDYFLVRFDDKKGNVDTEGNIQDGLVHFLYNEGYSCKGGFWGCPWYFIDITNKSFKPGRPGIKYGRVIGEYAITFEEFKEIVKIYKRHAQGSKEV